jgi:ABC-type multidrug transport system fused ATPase/permease subunit
VGEHGSSTGARRSRATPRSPRTGLSRLRRYTAGRGRAIALLAVVSAVAAAAPVAGWLLVGRAVDAARGDELELLTWLVAIYVAVNALGWALGTFVWRRLAGLGQSIVLAVRQHLFGHLTGLSLRYFSEQRAGWIIARLTSDVDALSDVLSQGLATLVSNVLMLSAAIVGLFILDWRLGLVALVVLPPGIVVTRWFQRRSHAAQSDVRTKISALTAQIAESVAGMAIVQAFNRERAFQGEFDELNAAKRQSDVVAQRISSVFFPAIELLGVIATVAVLAVGAWLHDAGSLTPGTLIAAVGVLSLIFQPLQELSEIYGQLQAASAAMEKISSVLDAEPELQERPGAERLGRVEGRVDFDRVSFAYGRADVLHEIELHVPIGGCIALVGESGGGKSTMAKLLGRFYDPREGAVRVDGRDLRDVRLESYRRQLGVVLQDPFLFSGTIADNVRFARPEATDDEVLAVAEAVGVARVAARLEDGLDHQVREGGAGLSAGERQLISIARALLADPRILILDEATSNIDRPTEILIERALDRLLRGRTSIIIAHRLSTVRRADEILVVDHGRIVQRGTERELLAEDGPFRSLARELSGSAVTPRPTPRRRVRTPAQRAK